MKRLGYLYVIRHNNLFKIGSARNLTNRLTQLRTAAPYLQRVHSILSPEYKSLERWLHMYFNRKRVIGEWFDLDEADIAFIKTVDAKGTQLEEMKFLLSYQENMRWGKRALREGKRTIKELGAFLDVLESLPKEDVEITGSLGS